MKTCIPLESPLALQSELTGGKGCNLSRLLRAGFHVPPGFVVSAHAYRQFAASIPWLNPAIDSLPIQCPSELAPACTDLQSRLRQTPLPAELAQAILAELAQHPADVAWCVRSSSTLEDLAGAAFAGQHDTFLNLSQPDAILRRVRDCFVSLWSDRAVAYRVSRGFAPAACDMAVVIQRLVDAEASGVGFTLNPINGRLDDEEHYQTTRLTPPLRRALREFGTRLVALDVISDPMDVFFARHAQVEAALAANSTTAWLDLARSIASQKAAYLADRQRSPDWELNPSSPQPLAHGPTSGELRGLAGSPGTAEGPVFIVRATDDFARFPRNAILVARTTNPGWTPLFYSAAALITESGGPLSHGAVTAREVRIPAVMAVKGCLQILREGDRVRVDGEHGIVTRLDSAP